MDGKGLANLVRIDRKHLSNIVNQFEEQHADFAPTPEMYTVAQQIRHIAHSITWFKEGAWGSGFDLDFEKAHHEVMRVASLKEAKADLDAAFDDFIGFLEGLSREEAHAPMGENPIFGTAPRAIVIGANTDHTAHHRGALAVYLRLLGITPKMVYAD